MNKRVLLIAEKCPANERRKVQLRTLGYDVDCTECERGARELTQKRSYDLVLVAVRTPLNGGPSPRKVASLWPSAKVAFLVDTSGPLPCMPAHKFLWAGESEEYFLARVEALAASA